MGWFSYSNKIAHVYNNSSLTDQTYIGHLTFALYECLIGFLLGIRMVAYIKPAAIAKG